MKKLLRDTCVATAFTLGLMATVPAEAGLAGSVKIAAISVLSSTYAVIVTDIPTIPGSPACAVSKSGMVVDLTTNLGKTALSLAQSALLAGAKVSMLGTNTCVTPGGGQPATEALATFVLLNQ